MNLRALGGLLAAVVILSACEGTPSLDVRRDGADAGPEASLPRHVREFVFVGSRDGEPLVAPFRFTTIPRDEEFTRRAQGWLAHGSGWDAFLDETFDMPAAGGVWRVVPRGPLRVIAGGPTEVQELVYRRGERVLRLEMQSAVSVWNRDDRIAYRFFRGQLGVGGEMTRGTVLEVQRAALAAADGTREALGDLDWMVLSDGAGLQILLAEAMGSEQALERTYAWTLVDGAEGQWEEASARWIELRTHEPARRDIPSRWTFGIPGAGITGEIEARGYEVELGPERAGRRAVDVRYTVAGWVRVGEGAEERRVFGMVRHTQD
jgi:hypothetical protein